MPEEVLFSTTTDRSRADVASLLREVADRLDDDGELTLDAGGESVALAVPPTVEFEVKAERETGDGSPELSVEFELEWDEDGADEADGSGELRIG